MNSRIRTPFYVFFSVRYACSAAIIVVVADIGERLSGPETPLILGKKKKYITEGKKSGQRKEDKTASPTPSPFS